MINKTSQGYYFLPQFAPQKKIIHGFSSKKFGDCREKAEKFLKAIGLDKKNLVLMEQVHGVKIKVVMEKDKGKIIPGVDGLLTATTEVILGVKSADCLPLLFYAPEARLIGAAHAGWKGVIAGLPQKMVDLLILKGALPGEIKVGVGPHIGKCCYQVKSDRVAAFLAKFGQLKGLINKKSGKIYLDLWLATKTQLLNSGILEKNIFEAGVCTSCQNENFFSKRKDSSATYGGMLSLICLQ
jgi:hypothetical protein